MSSEPENKAQTLTHWVIEYMKYISDPIPEFKEDIILVRLEDHKQETQKLESKLSYIEKMKVNVLDIFCQQGPPSKRWIETEGKYWEGWNACIDKILKNDIAADYLLLQKNKCLEGCLEQARQLAQTYPKCSECRWLDGHYCGLPIEPYHSLEDVEFSCPKDKVVLELLGVLVSSSSGTISRKEFVKRYFEYMKPIIQAEEEELSDAAAFRIAKESYAQTYDFLTKKLGLIVLGGGLKKPLLTLDELVKVCGYFDGSSQVNNYYNCKHPNPPESEYDSVLKRKVGACHSFCCPVAVRLGEDDGYDEETEMMEVFDPKVIKTILGEDKKREAEGDDVS